MKNILRLVVATFIVWSAPAFAADNTLIVTPGIGVTTRSKDIGAGLQLPYVGLSDGSGNAIGLIGAPAYIGFGTGVTLPAFASPPAVSLNTTPSLANGNGVVPTQGGNVLSATNGIFANVLQGNAVLSATNGLFSNLLQGNAVLSTSNPIFVTGTGTAGSAATNPITVQGISGGTNLPVILNAETTKVIGEVNQGTSPWVVSNGGTFAVQATLQASGSTAIGKVDPNTPANWGIGATGSAVPANAQYIGIISGGNLTGWTGAVTVGSGGITSGAVASGAIASGAVASGAIASGAYASGSIASGAMVDLGSQADSVCGSATGSCSLIALLKYLNNAAVSAVPGYYATAYNTCSQVTGTTAPICVDLNGNMYANISRYFGTVASPNASIMTVQPAGGDPCQTLAKTYTPINYSASGLNTTPLVAGTSGKKTYVCQIILNNNAAETVGIIETTTATSCATDVQALWGGATHSSSSAGFQFAATSGVSIGNGTSTVAITKTANDDICFIQSQATQMTGGILWVQQ